MIEIFKNYFTVKKFLIVIGLFLLTPFATLDVDNLVALFISSNYIPTVLNVAYIIFAYTRTSMVEEISPYIIQRIGINKYQNIHIKLALISIFIYCLLLYGVGFIFFKMPNGYENLVFSFLAINTLVYIIEESVILLQIGKNKNIIYFVIPVIINFVFRYVIVMPITNSIFA